MSMSPRLMRPRASSNFNPNNISGLEAWWDFSDETKVTLNGSKVSQVASKGLLTRNMSNSSDTTQPLYGVGVRNGRNAALFSANLQLNDTLSTISLPQPTTWFVVFQAPTSAGSWALHDGIVSRQHVFGNTDSEFRMFAGSTVLISSSLVGSQWYVAILTYNGAASTYRLSTRTPTTVSSTVGTNAITRPQMGATAGVRGYVGEFGIYSKALSSSEATSLANFLAARWSITLT